MDCVGAGPSLFEVEDLDSRGISQISLRRWREVEVSGVVFPGERSGASSVVYRDALYIFGGYGGNGRLNDLFRFYFPTREWSRVECKGSIPPGRENNGAVIYKNKMYLFGGYSGFTWLNDFHCFNFETSTWSPVPNGSRGHVPSTRFGYVSAVDSDFFFVFGGYDGSTWLNDMYEFDYEKGSWDVTRPIGAVPSGRSCPSWSTHRGSVYLFGGYDGVHRMNDFHQFRMESRTWTSVRSSGHIPSPRYFHACVVYADSLYVFGGYSGQERLNDLYEFRFDVNTWFLVVADDLPSGRSSLAAQVYNNSLYIFGGYNGSLVLNDFYEFRFEPVSIPPSSFSEDMRKLLNNPLYSDVIFLVEGQKICATKAHLSARSEHFRALFYGGMRESAADSLEPIPLVDISAPVFLLLLEYIYTDMVPDDLACDLAVPLLIAAEKYLLDRLKALCEDAIRKCISSDNVIQIMMAAKSHRAEGLKEICMDFIIANEEKIKTTSPHLFKELIQEPTLLYELFMRRKGASDTPAIGFSATV